MKDQERRGRTRVTYLSDLECENGGTRLAARTHDVSTSGIFIRSLVVWEPGSHLKLRFWIGSTRIETIAEVCYSLPQIGMGVRFLELKPEHSAAIERLIENRRNEQGGEGGIPIRAIISSGVEPVDKLLGGLDRGGIYLVHGDASGKSLFGLQFIIEGLNSGDNTALVTPYSPQDAVRRFSRLGYDCKEDLDCGRLAIIRYPGYTAEEVSRLREPTPVFHDLESMLGETFPDRLVFDPVTTLLVDKEDELSTRARAFTAWARTLGAAVVLIANSSDREVVDALKPLVRESFRFDARENQDRIIRLLAFEKSPSVADQPIRVDPSRGVFLLERQAAREPTDRETSVASPSVITGDPSAVSPDGGREPTVDTWAAASTAPSTELNAAGQGAETPRDELSVMLDELRDFASALYLDNSDTLASPQEAIADITEADSRLDLPFDAFAVGEQLGKDDLFWPDDDESVLDSVEGNYGAQQLQINDASQSHLTDWSPQADQAQEQADEEPSQQVGKDDTQGPLANALSVDSPELDSRNERAAPNNHADRKADGDAFKSYGDFVARIFTRIEDGLNDNYDSPFSIVSCRLPKMTANGGRVALRLFDLVHSIISSTDSITTNKRNDLVILLENTNSARAAAFVNRLRWMTLKEMHQEPSIRLWSLPRPEAAAATPSGGQTKDGTLLAEANRQRGENPAGGRSDTERAS